VGAGRELVLLVERREDGVLHEIVGGLALTAQEARERAKVWKQRYDVVPNHRAQISRDDSDSSIGRSYVGNRPPPRKGNLPASSAGQRATTPALPRLAGIAQSAEIPHRRRDK